MKILYLNHNLKGEGTYFRAFNLARELAKRGLQYYTKNMDGMEKIYEKFLKKIVDKRKKIL
jgi:hypothetical protein